MRLSRDDILKAEDNAPEELEVPKWGGSVLVRGMTGRERDEFEASLMEERAGRLVTNYANSRAKVIAMCVVDEDGKRLFTSSDVAALGEKGLAALSCVYDAACRLSGLSGPDVAEAAENFGGTPGEDSSSGSPGTSESPSAGS